MTRHISSRATQRWLPWPFSPTIWLGLGAALLTALLLKRSWSSFDDGVYLWAAQRLLDGAVLHGDLHGNHPGYSLYLDAWLSSVFGSDFSVLRYPLPLIAGTLTAVIAWLLQPLGRAMQYTAAFAAASLGVVQFITPSSGWYAIAISALALATFVKAIAAPDTQSSMKWMLLAGLLIGVCVGFRQLNAAMLGAGLVILHAWINKPVSDAPPPTRKLQILSLLALLLASLLTAIPALAAPSLLAWVYTFPVLWCAGCALTAWKRNVHARDPRWLIPVMAGCLLGFLPALAIPAVQGVLPGFFSDTVTDAFVFSGYSELRGVDFNLAFADAFELFSLGTVFAGASGVYLTIVGLAPLLLSVLLCLSPRTVPDRTASIALFAAISMPISITFQGLIYASYWLPAVMAALLALAAGMSVRTKKAVIIIVALPAIFALVFLSGRVSGSRLFELLSKPGYRLVACTLPRCDLYVDSDLLADLSRDYDDIRANVPADRPLMLLPAGASLYASLPNPSPWSTSFVIEGLFSERQVAKLRQEFLGQPNAVLAVSRNYPSPNDRTEAFEPFTRSLCLVRESPRHRFFATC